MKTVKTAKMMSKAVCASALMLPLALPVATQAPSATPPVGPTIQASASPSPSVAPSASAKPSVAPSATAKPSVVPSISATPAPTKNPSKVVAGFLQAVQTGRNQADYSAYLGQALEQRVRSGELVSTLLGIQNDYATFSVSNYTIDGAGRASLTATLNFNTPLQRPMTLVQENGVWQIESIMVPEAASSMQPSDTVAEFLTRFVQEGRIANYPKYFTSALTLRVGNEAGVLRLLGVQNVPHNFTLSKYTIDASGRATVTASLNFGTGSVHPTFTLVPQYGTWLIDNIVPEQTQPAPSATPSINVTWTGTPAFPLTVVQDTPALRYTSCLQTNTTYSFSVNANMRMNGAYNAPVSTRSVTSEGVVTWSAGGYAVTFDPAAVSGSGPRTYTVGVTLHTPSTPTTEQSNFFVALDGLSNEFGGLANANNPDPNVFHGATPPDASVLFVGVPCLTAAPAQPSATAKPSASTAPSATPQASGTPSTLPNTGAGESMWGGLLAAGAAVVAASGGFLLRRRAR